MTVNNGPEDKKPGMGGKEQRPYATLDLTAEEVPSKESAAQKAAEKQDALEKSKSAAEIKEKPRIEGSAKNGPLPPDSSFNIRGFATHMAAGVVGGVIALIIGYFVYWGGESSALSPEEAQRLRGEIADAEKRISAFEGELRQTSAKAAQLEPAADGIDRLQQTVAALSERISAIEGRPGAATISEKTVQQSIDPLTARLNEVEEKLGRVAKAQDEMQTNSRGAALALALYNLRRAANEGKPYAAELLSVAELSPVPLDLAVLEKYRDQGVPSLEQLIAKFDSAANEALDAENQPATGSFASELWSKARSFVRVRRKGDVPGNSTPAILARIEYRLKAGDLRSALSETEQLQGSAAMAVEAWKAELEAKLAADEALSKVESKLLTELGHEDTAKRGG